MYMSSKAAIFSTQKKGRPKVGERATNFEINIESKCIPTSHDHAVNFSAIFLIFNISPFLISFFQLLAFNFWNSLKSPFLKNRNVPVEILLFRLFCQIVFSLK